MQKTRPTAYYGWTDSPVGALLLAAARGKLVALKLPHDDVRKRDAVEALHREFGDRFALVQDAAVIEPLAARVRACLDGSAAASTVSASVDLTALTPFQRDVLLATARIPRGKVASYGEIAERIGRPKAARAVGQALHINPVPLVIPCHRVVASGGGPGGFGGGLDLKRRLLAREGVAI